MQSTPKAFRKFDVKELNPAIRPQDDFFAYTNSLWIQKNPIPENESRWGVFVKLRVETEKRLKKILTDLEKAKQVEKGSPEQMIRDFYRSGMDMKKRNQLGLSPIQDLRKMIQEISTADDLLLLLPKLHTLGIEALWGFGVGQDAKQSEKYILHLGQDGLGLPDRDYYLKDDAESKRVLDAYKVHVQKICELSGQTVNEAKRSVESILSIETRLAKASMTKEDIREIEKVYHKFTVAKLCRHTPALKWKEYLKHIDAGKVTEVIFMQTDFFTEVQEMLSQVNIDDWKIYLDWHLVSSFSGLLSQKFTNANFAFYGKVLSGTKKIKPLWRLVLSVVNGTLDELLGQIYVKEYFSPTAKKKVTHIVDTLFTAYKNRIESLDWMSASTKKKALQKLSMMVSKVGYPDKWESFKGLDIRPNDYVGNAIRSTVYEHKREIKKLGKPVDRNEWFMSPQTINAYCNHTMNEIVFPAAILQWPFYDEHADDAINYGCIGATIGHEMTHNFDNEGSKYDGKGNLKSWWSASDKAKFEKKSKVLVEQFNTYQVADGISVNGRLTLGENIADLGGVSIAFDAYQLHLAKVPGKTLDGFTPEQRFFLGFSLFEREVASPELQKLMVLTDEHSPSEFRINGVLSNLPEFYKAFNLKKGDKLYRESSKIAKIW
jgi:putative endopeptidase